VSRFVSSVYFQGHRPKPLTGRAHRPKPLTGRAPKGRPTRPPPPVVPHSESLVAQAAYPFGHSASGFDPRCFPPWDDRSPAACFQLPFCSSKPGSVSGRCCACISLCFLRQAGQRVGADALPPKFFSCASCSVADQRKPACGSVGPCSSPPVRGVAAFYRFGRLLWRQHRQQAA
jgi:hypothetical protein